MKQYIVLIALLALVGGCAGGGDENADVPAAGEETSGPAIKLQVEEPEPLPVPEYAEPASDTDWPAKVSNKDREIIEVLNIVNPVAAYIVAGFEGYSDRFSPTLQEEWEDTQVQLTAALGLYESCKGRIAAGEFDKQLFLDMEEVWQLLVKTGVAGVRTKSMIDAELSKMTG